LFTERKPREVNMKTLNYILIISTAILSSCATGLYVGGEYDDLYYSPSDKPVMSVQKNIPEQIAEGNLNPEQYYDNIYANDTLVADGYNDAVDFNNSMYYNKGNSAFEYMDDFSYSNRLRRFYGNYFDPFWRSSIFNGFGYPSYGYGYGYDPYGGGYGMYDPYYGGGYGGYYGGGYGGYYGGGYGGFYGGYYGSIFSPFGYSGYGFYPGSYSHGDDYSTVTVGRRERYSTLTNSYNPSSPARKSYNQPGEGLNGETRRTGASSQSLSTETRRTNSINGSSRQSVTSIPENRYTQQGVPVRRDISNSSNRVSPYSRPEYRSVDRTYTPSYNNPRMSTRPSYNNSRTQSGTNSNTVPNNSRINNESLYRGSNPVNNNPVRSNSSNSQGQSRSVNTNSGRSESYSVPTRRDMDSGSGYSSGRSYNNSSSGGSSSSYGGSSYSSGSSSSGSSRSSSGSSSYSGGSSGSSGGSSGSSVSTSSSSGSSATRR
jgi:hypothetical protein